MKTATILSAAFAGLAAAETAELLLLDFEGDIVAFPVGKSDTATTYVLGCPVGADGNDCGFGGVTMTHVEGPKTAAYELSMAPMEGEAQVTVKQDCKINGNTATCTQIANGMTYTDEPSDTTSVTTIDLAEETRTPVTIVDNISSIMDFWDFEASTYRCDRMKSAFVDECYSMYATATMAGGSAVAKQTGSTMATTTAPVARQTGTAGVSAGNATSNVVEASSPAVSEGLAAQVTGSGAFVAGLVAAGLAVAAL